jgi:tripartite-type tricarboxylate transporter receptor subunit TctC
MSSAAAQLQRTIGDRAAHVREAEHDSIRDFEPLYQGGIVPYILVVNSSSPQDPAGTRGAGAGPMGRQSAQFGGNGTTSQRDGNAQGRGGLKFTHAVQGSVPALNDLAAGAVRVVLETVSPCPT